MADYLGTLIDRCKLLFAVRSKPNLVHAASSKGMALLQDPAKEVFIDDIGVCFKVAGTNVEITLPLDALDQPSPSTEVIPAELLRTKGFQLICRDGWKLYEKLFRASEMPYFCQHEVDDEWIFSSDQLRVQVDPYGAVYVKDLTSGTLHGAVFTTLAAVVFLPTLGSTIA